ncbi:MAG: class I SAM-dependent methyltransferase [bacterium]|nr:class I SAM-dependent methyltransferase [bacterium]
MDIFSRLYNSLSIKDNRSVAENWHENFIIHLASLLRPKIYLELGLYKCELFNKMIPFAEKLIGVDISLESEKYIKKLSKTEFICSDANTYAQYLKKNPIKVDLLFIDANHSKESVLNDFQNYFPFISNQGIILFHDTYPKNKFYTQKGYCGDCYKAIEKLSKYTDKYEMMTIPVHPGLTLCRKKIITTKYF